jgi:hypothetical protein
MDICPNGDFSSSYYDGDCGTAPVSITTDPVLPNDIVDTPAPSDPVIKPLYAQGVPTIEDDGQVNGTILPKRLLTT